VGTVTGFVNVKPNDSEQLKSALANHGPIAIGIQANQDAFQYYKSGIITSGCGQDLDHGVLAVGYGIEDGTPYFLVKNSWGTWWGDKGYVKIGAGQDNTCGILSMPSFPI